MIVDVYPHKAQYRACEDIKIIIELCENCSANVLNVQVRALEKLVEEHTVHLCGEKRLVQPLSSRTDAFAGYGVDVLLLKDKELLCSRSTAFDVVDGPSRILRYGFLSDFNTGDAGEEDIVSLLKFHINTVQFYDWSYRPDEYVATENVYADTMGKPIDLRVVRQKIEACHAYGMKAIAYGAVYASSKAFFRKHTDWGLYSSANEPYSFIEKFYIMNISRECGWHNHIISQYGHAVEQVGFDGIHMDAYGFPKSAYSADRKRVELEDHFSDLINDTRTTLEKLKKEICLLFNNVGNWPSDSTASAAQDCVYIEVWPPFERYHHLKQLVLDAKRSTKPVVLAAYLAPFRTESPKRALNAALLASCVIAFNGGTHLLLGEDNAVLTQGYYVDHSHLEEEQVRTLRRYADFFVRYVTLLYNVDAKDVSMTHAGWDNPEYVCTSPFSAYGEPGKLFLALRQSRRSKMIGIINLCGITDDFWNSGKETPVSQLDVGFEILVEGEIEGVYVASPEYNDSRARSLDFEYLCCGKGLTVKTMVPEVSVCALLWLVLKEKPEA